MHRVALGKKLPGKPFHEAVHMSADSVDWLNKVDTNQSVHADRTRGWLAGGHETNVKKAAHS